MRLILLVTLIFFSVNVLPGELITLYDSGNTWPTLEYMPKNTPKQQRPSLKEALNKRTNPVNFPITSSSLSPGKVTPKAFTISHLQIPIFLIGNDEWSKQWLTDRVDELRQLGAMGMLVEVANMDQLKEITKIAAGIKIFPASGDDIAKQLNITHYPILISKFGLEQ